MTRQVAVKLPDGLVSGEVIDRRYRDAAARCPDTKDEIAEATDLAIKAIHEEPWEPWW